MTALINASTSSGVVVTSDTSGSLAFQSNGTTIMTVSSTGLTMNTGNIVVASTAAPAFSAYMASDQTGQSSGVWTKAIFATEEFDTNNNFASSRFTPTVAGYYQINGELDVGGSGLNYAIISIYKNGSIYRRGTGLSATQNEQYATISTLVYLNGTTDYVEIYGYTSASSGIVWYAGGSSGWFSGCMIRSA